MDDRMLAYIRRAAYGMQADGYETEYKENNAGK